MSLNENTDPNVYHINWEAIHINWSYGYLGGDLNEFRENILINVKSM